MKCCDKILQQTIFLSAHILEGKIKLLETLKKSEEILHCYLIFSVFMDFYCDVIKRNVHVLVTILCQYI